MTFILKKTSVLTAMTIFCLLTGAGYVNATLSGSVNPSSISIGTTFNGQDIIISGDVSKGAEILIRITGEKKAEKFKKKGKILGLLWMNLNTIEMENVPSMMLIAPSDYLENWLEKHPGQWKSTGLGFEAVKDNITLFPESEDKDMIFEELLKLKKKEGLYGIRKKAVIYTNNEEITTYEARIHLPAGLPPGVYNVEILAIGGGHVLEKKTLPLPARQVGFPAFLSSLAFEHGLLYGILSVIIAIMAGLIIGFMFRGGQGAH
ncbi:MAG: hypothetical protein GXP53_00385 [Deltaproteobacteria bacterium]|nr:hypothetical protein [Deltaproteobacteria bacterium]